MTLYKWSQTASADATADSTINWAEGQAPSSVNDSARAMMAATAKYRDDIAGAIMTAGSSTAYTVSSYQVFDTLTHLSGQMIAFTPHVTNAATVTLNVDALGDRPLRTAPGLELQAGTIIRGTPYVAVYNDSDGAFYLQGFFGNPYNVPIGAGLDYWGATAPNSSFVFPVGQAISRITYAALFSLVGTTYGSGDGSTTFSLPDKRGRASFAADNMGGNAAVRLTSAGSGVNGESIGGSGGSQNHTLTAGEIPTITSVYPGGAPFSASGSFTAAINSETSSTPGGGFTFPESPNSTVSITVSGAIPALGGITSNNTGGGAHAIMPPAIVCNYIFRVI